MALTFSEVLRSTVGQKRLVVTDCTLSQYAPGGLPLQPSHVDMMEIRAVLGDGALGYNCSYDKSTQKLKVYTAAGVEATAKLPAVTITLLIIGT